MRLMPDLVSRFRAAAVRLNEKQPIAGGQEPTAVGRPGLDAIVYSLSLNLKCGIFIKSAFSS